MTVNKVLAILLLSVFAAVPSLADVYGDTPLPAPPAAGINDYCLGCLFAYAQAPAAANGQVFSSWSFDTVSVPYGPDGVGNGVITPLLFDSNFTLVAIGTTQTVLPGKQYNFAFGLTDGHATVATGDYFGWVDGNSKANGGDDGIIALTYGGPGILVYTCGSSHGTAGGPCNNPGGAKVGTNYGPLEGYGTLGMDVIPGRTYDVNFTTSAAAPEPGFYVTMALGLGLTGLMTAVSRRKNRA